ncbi:MAG: phosphoribosylglycinamide formyltransferase [bacterium]
MTVNLAVLASGRGSNFASIADACERGDVDADPALLLSDKNNAECLDRARRRGIEPHYIPYSESDREQFERQAARLIRKNDCDLIALAGFMRILSSYFVNEFEGRILNIHPSLLPAFRGLEAQKQALEYGVKVTGCTVHVVTEELDAGPIVDQIAVRVQDDDTVDTLSARILEQEHKLYPRAIQKFIDEELRVTRDR